MRKWLRLLLSDLRNELYIPPCCFTVPVLPKEKPTEEPATAEVQPPSLRDQYRTWLENCHLVSRLFHNAS